MAGAQPADLAAAIGRSGRRDAGVLEAAAQHGPSALGSLLGRRRSLRPLLPRRHRHHSLAFRYSLSRLIQDSFEMTGVFVCCRRRVSGRGEGSRFPVPAA